MRRRRSRKRRFNVSRVVVLNDPPTRTSALPTMTPSAPQFTTCAACSPFEMPNPTAT
jgi:hypothetical protein